MQWFYSQSVSLFKKEFKIYMLKKIVVKVFRFALIELFLKFFILFIYLFNLLFIYYLFIFLFLFFLIFVLGSLSLQYSEITFTTTAVVYSLSCSLVEVGELDLFSFWK